MYVNHIEVWPGVMKMVWWKWYGENGAIEPQATMYQCYHKIFNCWEQYLLKNYHEPYSGKMAPTSKFLVPSSWTKMKRSKQLETAVTMATTFYEFNKVNLLLHTLKSSYNLNPHPYWWGSIPIKPVFGFCLYIINKCMFY